MKPLPRLRATLLAVALAVIGVDTAAQDLEPRTYTNTPVGLNFFIASYAYTSGGVATDPTIPLETQNRHLVALSQNITLLYDLFPIAP
jgi:hypothetical protein